MVEYFSFDRAELQSGLPPLIKHPLSDETWMLKPNPWWRARRAECRTGDNKKEDPQGDSSAMCVNMSCSLNQAHTILSTIDQRDYVSKVQSSGNGNFEARCDDLPRGHSNEGGIDQEMEIEGDGEPISI
nr:hypothetical protein CFP56_29760 [Quercus suber]